MALTGLAERLGMLPKTDAEVLVARYGELIRRPSSLPSGARSPKPEV